MSIYNHFNTVSRKNFYFPENYNDFLKYQLQNLKLIFFNTLIGQKESPRVLLKLLAKTYIVIALANRETTGIFGVKIVLY